LQIPLRKIVRFQNGKDSSYNSSTTDHCRECMYRAGESTVKVLWRHQEVVVILSNGFESNSTTILFTGSIYSPSISKPPPITFEQVQGLILVSGCQWLLQFILPRHWWVCLFRLRMPSYVKGPLIFTANGGADLFEFSIDGIIKQQMQTESFKLLRWKRSNR
jgi:hypothetical protein